MQIWHEIIITMLKAQLQVFVTLQPSIVLSINLLMCLIKHLVYKL